MYNNTLRNNPLLNYEDVKLALLDILKPYAMFRSPGYAGIDSGPSGATFSNKTARLEGFTRMLWGIIPYIAGGNRYDDLEKIISGISNGVNPEHSEFWGLPGDYDQALVEMSVFGYALGLIPDKLWSNLTPEAKKNFTSWLSHVNKKTIPDCNWHFFRILVNCGLRNVDAKEFDRHMLEESLKSVDRCYLDSGWYNDGFIEERRARDYYIPWAYHYFSLITLHCCPASSLIPGFAAKIRERAALFAKDFLYWFDRDGAALPYGRSLTYRFAQTAFWGAAGFANQEVLPWGHLKGLYLRNLRWWFKQPLFSETGLLTPGYTYPNLNVAERYISANSPLWALQAFIPLALNSGHPFWEADEELLEKPEEPHLQKATGFIICDTGKSGHLYALNAGQWTPGDSNEHNHMAEKYLKFAYSNYFGFNVVTGTRGLDKLAPDNMLLISNGDRYYRYRTECSDHSITCEYLYSKWSPFEGMMIETYIVPRDPWSLRFHNIVSKLSFLSTEGGFALPYDDGFYPIDNKIFNMTDNESHSKTELGFSGIKNIRDSRKGKIINANPNSNIIHPRTLIPTLMGTHSPGSHWLGCAVIAHPDPEQGESIWLAGIDLQEIWRRLPFTIE